MFMDFTSDVTVTSLTKNRVRTLKRPETDEYSKFTVRKYNMYQEIHLMK